MWVKYLGWFPSYFHLEDATTCMVGITMVICLIHLWILPFPPDSLGLWPNDDQTGFSTLVCLCVACLCNIMDKTIWFVHDSMVYLTPAPRLCWCRGLLLFVGLVLALLLLAGLCWCYSICLFNSHSFLVEKILELCCSVFLVFLCVFLLF